MRYTEARLTPLAIEMLADIDSGHRQLAAELFDGPATGAGGLPSRFPNLLCNGSDRDRGRHGDADSPHNLSEIVDALVALIDEPESTVEGSGEGFAWRHRFSDRRILLEARDVRRVRERAWPRDHPGQGDHREKNTERPLPDRRDKYVLLHPTGEQSD